MRQLDANIEATVLARYGNAAREVEDCLCLPVGYDQALLKVIPQEIVEKDYGCGYPSRYVREGEIVLNLVRPQDKRQLFAEMYRVLKRGGRVAISDIISDEPVPEHLTQDPNLWSACVSGAFLEEEFLRAFEEAKFHGIQIEEFSSEP